METSELLGVLERQRERERDFAANWHETPGGWTGGQLFGHLAAWRKRLLHCLATGEPPPTSADEINDAEIPALRGEDTAAAAARAGALLERLRSAVSDRGPDTPLRWYSVNTLGEAVLRNAVGHPSGLEFFDDQARLDSLAKTDLVGEEKTMRIRRCCPMDYPDLMRLDLDPRVAEGGQVVVLVGEGQPRGGEPQVGRASAV